MNKEEFRRTLSTLESAKSVTGKKYSSIYLEGENLLFLREGKNKFEKISIEDLYSFYSGSEPINTSTAKLYNLRGVQSPAVAILSSLGKRSKYQFSKSNKGKLPKVKPKKTSDEMKLFKAFSEIVGKEYLLSKSIDKPVTKDDIFLSNNYLKYNFSKEVKNAYQDILRVLKSSFTFSSDSLSHNVDGLVKKHPSLGNRIIEFDEEQHFTPARKDTLETISKITNNPYAQSFLAICKDLNYLNREVLPKNRIKMRLTEVPQNFDQFVEGLQSSGEKESGYIKSKNGFEFFGGRLAQRAYYDCLRDTAHLSGKNKDFLPPLRFAKKTFEDEAGTTFGRISEEKLEQLIIMQLKRDTVPQSV